MFSTPGFFTSMIDRAFLFSVCNQSIDNALLIIYLVAVITCIVYRYIPSYTIIFWKHDNLAKIMSVLWFFCWGYIYIQFTYYCNIYIYIIIYITLICHYGGFNPVKPILLWINAYDVLIDGGWTMDIHSARFWCHRGSRNDGGRYLYIKGQWKYKTNHFVILQLWPS